MKKKDHIIYLIYNPKDSTYLKKGSYFWNWTEDVTKAHKYSNKKVAQNCLNDRMKHDASLANCYVQAFLLVPVNEEDYNKQIPMV